LHAERGGGHQVALQRDAILVAAGELKNRLDAVLEQKPGGSDRAEMGARAGAVGDIDRVGATFERRRLGNQVAGVAGSRRGDFDRDDEATAVELLLQCCHGDLVGRAC
jgi:hypothetical protein